MKASARQKATAFRQQNEGKERHNDNNIKKQKLLKRGNNRDREQDK